MAEHRFKINPQTLIELEELTKLKNQSNREILEYCISRYYQESKEKKVVYPVAKYKKSLKDLTESSAPYTVEKEIPSTTGLSGGLVKLENCEIAVPSSWLTSKENTTFPIKVLANFINFISGNFIALWITAHLWVIFFLLL